MEASNSSPDAHTTSSSSVSTPSSPMDSSSGSSRRYGFQFPPQLRFIHSPVSSLLEYSGFFRLQPDHSQPEPLIIDRSSSNISSNGVVSSNTVRPSYRIAPGNASGNGEVSIRIIGAGEGDRVGPDDDLDEESVRLDSSVDGSDHTRTVQVWSI